MLLLVHGWPESSYMWRDVMDPLAAAGWRVVAPDLLGFGDSPSDPPHTWERQIAALDAFRRAEGLDRLTLVVHDWGGLIGLRWACDHPEAVQRLVISCTGFFPDGRWHGLARTLRSPDAGEELIEGMTREDFGRLLGGASSAIDDLAADEYFKAFSDAERRHGSLELYRSGDMEKLAAYEGRLAALAVPTLILWGADDPFAPVAGAHRFHAEIPGSELVVLDGTGHFVVEDAPQRFAAALLDFLERR